MRTAKQTARIFGLSAVQVKICANCGKQFPIVSPTPIKSKGGREANTIRGFAAMRVCG